MILILMRSVVLHAADDSKSTDVPRDLLATTLRSIGYETIEAETGTEGVEKAVTEKPQLFPMMSGSRHMQPSRYFVIQGLRLTYSQKKGYFLFMPGRKVADGTYIDIVHPLNNETRQMIQDRVVAEYEKIAGEAVKTRL